jgi:hypothetical protein
MMTLDVNPYNFQVPVSRAGAFAGRASERREIQYYLDQALKTRPTNLAIIGPRAAGKTSLLNMIELDARARGIVAVRVNFDEDHARSQLHFFSKIFDALVSEIVKQPRALDGKKCFGGPGGRLMELYTQCVASYERADFGDLELVFPNFIAAAMAKQGRDVSVPQSFFVDDLLRIATEVGRPIALIMDECNIVVRNQSILQAMRHMFQNLEQYMLVMTGTEQMFPVIDEVYSPVGRGFKRISVVGFSDPRDTFACMERPCVEHGVPLDVLANFQPQSVKAGNDEYPPQLRDLHEFTSGNPHEIQLACHFMFRDVQERSSLMHKIRALLPASETRTLADLPMLLNSDVIARVLKELAPDEQRGATLKRIQSLDVRVLDALGLLTRVGFGFSKVTYSGFVESERAFDTSEESDHTSEESDRSALSIPDFELGVNGLLATGWLVEAEVGHGFRWIAPQLEEILVKYAARSRGAMIGAYGPRMMLRKYIAYIVGLSRHPQVYISGLGPTLAPWSPTPSAELAHDQIELLPEWMSGRAIHVLGDKLQLYGIGCKTREFGWTVRTLVIPSADLDADAKESVAQWQAKFDRAHATSEIHGVEWRFWSETCSVTSSWGSIESDWTQPLANTEILTCRLWMFGYHKRLCDRFLSGESVRAVLEQLLPRAAVVAHEWRANFGYMALAYGMPESRPFLEGVARDPSAEPLSKYNCALASLFSSTPDVSTAVAELKAIPPDDAPGEFQSMLSLGFDDSALVFTEWRPPSDGSASPPLKSFVESAIVALERSIASGAPQRVIAARSEV